MSAEPGKRANWLPLSAAFAVVLAAQLWLVGAIGTDIPFQDQWDVEGRLLYGPAIDGSLHFADLFRSHNEHRIAWTQGMNLLLFRANGQWDPLVQLAVNALLHSLCAAAVVALLGSEQTTRTRWLIAAGVSVASLPLAGWHNAIWGFQSQVYFAVLFAVVAFHCLSVPDANWSRRIVGWLAIVAALFAMGAGGLVPVALLGLVVLRAIENRRIDRGIAMQAVPAAVLLGAALLLRVQVPELDSLHAGDAGQYLTVAMRTLAWPHVAQPLAAIVMILPMAIAVVGRVADWRKPVRGEDAVLLAGGWGVLIALAAAWTRGGSGEFLVGVPSRYADFLVLLPLANVWFAIVLASEGTERWRARARLLAGVWVVFLLVGWVGLSAEVMRRIILPRARDREAPVRLVRAFQISGTAKVFIGQPRLLLPHPSPESVRVVLNDPRMKDVLPPSLQPARPMGPLSRAVRWLLGR